MTNIITLTDSYKFTHWLQYPDKTRRVYSYFESRGGQFSTTVFFGLQYFLKKYLEGEVVTMEKIDQAEKLVQAHLGNKKYFNRAGWEYIVKNHGGKLPLVIKAVQEGTEVPVSNVLMTVENTDDACFWLTNYVETLLVQVWYPTTVATQSKDIYRTILSSLERTGDPNLVNFKLHDFGFRGVSSVESAGIGGCAQQVIFQGTDTVAALELAMAYYKSEMPGFSIPAAEHSTITSWGRDNEAGAYLNMLEKFPEGLVAVVSDSYDIFNACKNIWGNELKAKVLERNGTLVVRPDSGDPVEVVTEVIKTLDEAFGSTVNAKGFKVLNPKVRVIQGDGVDRNSIKAILARLEAEKYSADNIAFGMGGALLQKLNRDTNSFAFKCASITVGNEERDVYKKPATDSGKKSKRGRMKLIRTLNGFETVPETYPGQDELVEVFRNGVVTKEWNFAEVRAKAQEV